MKNYSAARCDGLERQLVQNVVLLPFTIDLCILRMTRTCQRLAGTFSLHSCYQCAMYILVLERSASYGFASAVIFSAFYSTYNIKYK